MSPDSNLNSNQLKKLIREVPDFPKKGILFYDITTLLKDKVGFATLVDRLSEQYVDQKNEAEMVEFGCPAIRKFAGILSRKLPVEQRLKLLERGFPLRRQGREESV